jgi:hypothetical protein
VPTTDTTVPDTTLLAVDPVFSNVRLSPGKLNGAPTSVVTSFAADVAEICVFWSYSGMADGVPYGVDWTTSSQAITRATNRSWAIGAGGTANWCVSGPFPSGTHTFVVSVHGVEELRTTFRVG